MQLSAVPQPLHCISHRPPNIIVVVVVIVVVIDVASCDSFGSLRAVTFFVNTSKMQRWYYAEACPLDSECSQSSWKRAHCAADSEENVRKLVKKHLVNSGHHKRDPFDAETWASMATISWEEFSANEIDSWTDTHTRKRKQTDHGDESKGSTHLTKEQVKEVVANAIAALSQDGHDTEEHSPDGDNDASGSGLRVLRSKNVLARREEALVTLRYTQLKSALDCLSRAERGCRGAEKVLQQAANAFADEAKNIASAADDIRQLIHRV